MQAIFVLRGTMEAWKERAEKAEKHVKELEEQLRLAEVRNSVLETALAEAMHRAEDDERVLHAVASFLENMPPSLSKAKGGAAMLATRKEIALQVKTVLEQSWRQGEADTAATQKTESEEVARD